jgi:hypothetical protein
LDWAEGEATSIALRLPQRHPHQIDRTAHNELKEIQPQMCGKRVGSVLFIGSFAQ